jgi:hypothetical protein
LATSACASASAQPSASTPAAASGLVIRGTSCSDACTATAGTTILDDGRIIWENAVQQVRASILTDAALERVRGDLAAVPALGESGSFSARLRPGRTANPHGVGFHQFELGEGADRIVVTTVDPGSFADQPDAWIIPPEAFELTALAQRLGDPAAWLGPDAFSEPVGPFVPTGYLVKIVPYPEIGVTGSNVDVDDVTWPFAGPIELVGEPLPGEPGEPVDRCLLLDAATGRDLLAAEAAAGAVRNIDEWGSTVVYDWARGGGWVDVSLVPLLPHQTGPCTELVAESP